MFSWLKKHFIPHEGNEHRPHFLRGKNIRNVIFIILFLEIFTFLLPTITHINTNGGMASVLPSILSNLTNQERQNENLNTLTINPILNKAAEMKANDMASKSYFAHTSPEGKTPWYWLAQVGYQYQYAGENLAINFTDSKDVTNAWMASPTHKANIIKKNYTEIGTGIATGMYEGKETTFVAQVYANPLPKEIIQTEPIKKEVTSMKEIFKDIKPKEMTNVLGAETNTQITKTSIVAPTFFQTLFASPRNNTNKIFLIIFGVIILSLVLNIIIKIKHHHPDLIMNGLITLVIIGAILIANYYFSYKNMITTESIDYSSENK